jgi:hypothetical protein
VAYLKSHYAPTFQMQDGITAYHRSLRVDGGELIETMDLMQYGSRGGHLVVRVNLADLDELMVSDDTEVGVVCKTSSMEGMPSCFSANTGQSSADHVYLGVRNQENSRRC